MFDFLNWVMSLRAVIFLFLKLYICITYSLSYLIDFYLSYSVILGARTATTNSGYMCGVQRVKPISQPEGGRGGRTGSSWGTVGVPGSSWLQPGSAWIKHHAQAQGTCGGGSSRQVVPEALGDLIHVWDWDQSHGW